MSNASVLLRCLAVLLLCSANAFSADPPQTTHDGLQLVPSKNVELLYVQPGATLAPYNKVALIDCQVAFRKNWQRDQNTSRHNRVSAKDMERIKGAVADEFREAFTEELKQGGYGIVTETGDDVMIVRPAIIDLDITAPDTQQPGRSRTFATSAGSMTLFLEIYDGGTGAILARVVDPQAARDEFTMRWQNSVTNRAEAERIFKKWAALARAALDRAHAQRASGATP